MSTQPKDQRNTRGERPKIRNAPTTKVPIVSIEAMSRAYLKAGSPQSVNSGGVGKPGYYLTAKRLNAQKRTSSTRSPDQSRVPIRKFNSGTYRRLVRFDLGFPSSRS